MRILHVHATSTVRRRIRGYLGKFDVDMNVEGPAAVADHGGGDTVRWGMDKIGKGRVIQ